MGGAEADLAEAGGIDSLEGDELGVDGAGAGFGELLVRVRVALGAGVALDGEFRLGVGGPDRMGGRGDRHR